MFITIAAQKGAQGKTATAVNLAAVFARSRKGILCDVDFQQGDAHRYEGNIERVVWTKALPERAEKGGFVIVDTPPKIEEIHGQAFRRSDLVVIPCTPQGESLESLARTFQTIATAREFNEKLIAMVVFTCVDRSQYSAGAIAAARVLSEWEPAKSEVPLRKMDFERAFIARRPVVLNSPKSSVTLAYGEVGSQIEKMLGV